MSGFAIGAILGAPYLPVFGRDIDSLLELAELKKGETIVDLGCGDGRLLKAAAKKGVKGVGYEINFWLYLVARLNCWRYRRLVKIHLRDYWRVKLPEADVIYVFLIEHYMSKLDQKLVSELRHPTRVISYVFTIPGREPTRRTRNAALYLY